MIVRLNNLVKYPQWAYKRFGNPMVFPCLTNKPYSVETIIARMLKESIIVSLVEPVRDTIGMDILMDGAPGCWCEFVSADAEARIINTLNDEFRDELHSTIDLLMQQPGITERQAIYRFFTQYDISVDNLEAFHKDYYRWRYRDNRRIYLSQSIEYFDL